jgi:hypothetical protein|nr:MAG TPA: hypothetical protein [Caudoviricetes sp.]
MSKILTVRAAQLSYRKSKAIIDYTALTDSILQKSFITFMDDVTIVFGGVEVAEWDGISVITAGSVLTPDSLIRRLKEDPRFAGCDIDDTLVNGVQCVNIDFNVEKGDE